MGEIAIFNESVGWTDVGAAKEATEKSNDDVDYSSMKVAELKELLKEMPVQLRLQRQNLKNQIYSMRNC